MYIYICVRIFIQSLAPVELSFLVCELLHCERSVFLGFPNQP